MIMAQVVVVVVMLAIIAGVSCSTPTREEWFRWKQQHKKVYESDIEEEMRLRIWQHNHRLVTAHNMANLSYSLALNHFADLVSQPSQHYS